MVMWYKVKQLSDYLQISTSTIYSLARSGKIPATKIGGQWRFNKNEIDKSLNRKGNRNRNREKRQRG